MKLKTGVSSSFNNRDGSGSARSHHKGGTSMQTHPAVRVGFELRPWRPTASSSMFLQTRLEIIQNIAILQQRVNTLTVK